MAIQLIKVTNIGLQIGEDIAVPLLKAVISIDATATYQEMNALFADIYQAAVGMVGICAEWAPASFDIGAVQDATWGDDTGFKLILTTGSASSRRFISKLQLYFQGRPVGVAWDYTGYGTYEASFLTMFVDESDNVFKLVDMGGNAGPYIKSREDPGLTVISGKYVVSMVIEGTPHYFGGPARLTANTAGNIAEYITEEIDPDPGGKLDPYAPGGQSGTDGGDGTFDDTSVPVPIPNLPGISAVDTKFITLYNPSLSELQSLASYMWSSFDLNTFRKLFADPMDCILGLSIVPVAVPDGGQAEVKVGNIGTGVHMNRAASQYVAVDCGSIHVDRYWGAYLDYAPYTRAEIYLPYIGTHPLAVDDIMNRTVHVVYHVDILSGACTAFLESDGTVLYSFIGQCASSIPVSGNDFTNVINGVLGIAGAIGTMVATGGASAPMAVGAIASTATNSMKPTVEKSGSMSGTGGMLAVQVPYLILTRPKQALPGSQNKEMGYPAFITRILGNLSGYTEVESVHLKGIPCTSQELVEIETALKEGVIL